MKKNLQIFFIFILMINLVACNSYNATPIPEFDKSSTIKKEVLYDSNGVKISSKEIKFGDYYAELVLVLKNSTKTKLRFVTGAIGYKGNSLNEFMNNLYMNAEVSANEAVQETIKIGYDELVLKGIDSIAEMVLNFSIEPVKSEDETFERIKTGPLVIKTSNYDKYDFANNDRLKDRLTNKTIHNKYKTTLLDYSNEKKIYNSNNVSINSNYLLKNSDEEKIFFFEIVNNNDFVVEVDIKNIYFNDKLMYDTYWTGDTLTSKKRSILDINISKLIEINRENEMKLSDIKTVKFTLKVTNEDGNEVSEEKEIIINIK